MSKRRSSRVDTRLKGRGFDLFLSSIGSRISTGPSGALPEVNQGQEDDQDNGEQVRTTHLARERRAPAGPCQEARYIVLSSPCGMRRSVVRGLSALTRVLLLLPTSTYSFATPPISSREYSTPRGTTRPASFVPSSSGKLHSFSPMYFSPFAAIDMDSTTGNLILASALATCTDPVVATLWNETHRNNPSKNTDFRTTFSCGVADSITTGARVYLGLLAADYLANRLRMLPALAAVPLKESALTIAVTVWAALSFCTIKRRIFLQSVSGTSLGRVALYDRLIDFVAFLVATLLVLDHLQIDLTMSLQSLFTAGGVGALLFSLASRGLAEQIVSGFIVNAWDAIEEGNDVVLGDKTEGVVHRIGLVETEIMGYDNVVTKIPNSHLTAQRISNLSRVKRSRVKQVLRFKYKDLEKLPYLLCEIKDEIRAACPQLISDGTKPFQALLSSYEPDHVEAYVNCHFEIPPATGAYVENRQQVLLAIARAMRKHDVEFALPSILYETTQRTSAGGPVWAGSSDEGPGDDDDDED